MLKINLKTIRLCWAKKTPDYTQTHSNETVEWNKNIAFINKLKRWK